MRKLFIFTTLLALVLILATCKKDKTPECPPCSQNPESCHSVLEAKDYFAFKVGTWWVYEEETSKERDSMFVTEYYNNESNYDFDVRMYSSYQKYYYHYYPNYYQNAGCSTTDPIEKRCLYVRRSKYKSGEFIADDKCFFFNYGIGMFTYTFAINAQQEGNRIIVNDVFSKFDMGALSFGRTVQVHELYTHVENQQPTYHYFSKYIGLIRKELLDSKQIWNLVSYHIEK